MQWYCESHRFVVIDLANLGNRELESDIERKGAWKYILFLNQFLQSNLATKDRPFGPEESFCNQEEISIQIGFIKLLLTFFQQPNKNRWPPLPWLSICQRTFLSNNFIPLLLKNFSRKGEVWRELSLNVLIQFGGERKRVQSIFNHQTLWNNMLDDFPSWKIQISHFEPPNSLKNKNDFLSSSF